MSRPSGLSSQLKWRWRYEQKQFLRRSRSWIAYWPGSRRAEHSLWICSWQRSGSTWLAEMLSSAPGTRLLYEPANLDGSIFTGELAAASALPHEGARATSDVVAALKGQLHGPWVDQLNAVHLARRTVVKDVRALNLVGEVHALLPRTPVVVLTRHPIAVGRSAVKLGWTNEADGAAAFEREIDNWCQSHVNAFSNPELHDVLFVTYEAVRQDPRRELKAILEFATRYSPTWREVTLDRLDPERPSATSFRETAAPSVDGEQWSDLSVDLVTQAASVLRRYGLAELYNEQTKGGTEINQFVRDFRADPRSVSD